MGKKRKSYTVEYKKSIVDDSIGKNFSKFCREKNLNERVVRKWLLNYDNLSEHIDEGNAKKRKCGSGRQPSFPELESIVCKWFIDKSAEGMVVRKADIQKFALEKASQLEISTDKFKASYHWMNHFFKRYELCLREAGIVE